jgi:hypothetical protein
MTDDQSPAQNSSPLKQSAVWMRLLVGLWFAVTGFLLESAYFALTFRPWRISRGFEVFFYFVIVPSMIFALCGATIGAGILRKARGPGNALAFMGLGATVSAAAVVICIVGWAAFDTITRVHPRLVDFAFAVFYLGALWGLSRLIPFALLGAFSGWLLYRVKRRWID